MDDSGQKGVFFFDRVGTSKPDVRKKERARNRVLRRDAIIWGGKTGESAAPPLSVSTKKAIHRIALSEKKGKKTKKTAVNEACAKDVWGSEEATSTSRPAPPLMRHVRAIEIPPPGSSYNPSFEDHQDVLGEAVARELMANQWGEGPRSVKEDDNDHNDHNHADDNDNKDRSDQDSSDSDEPAPQPPKPTVRVTQAQRNKRKRHQARMYKQARRRTKKRREKELARLPGITRELETEERRHLEEKRLQECHRQVDPPRQPRLGRLRYREPQQEVLLTEELPSSLRKLKGVGSLLTDRYTSLQKRCLIEPRDPVKRMKRRYRLKQYERR